jgi:hypothetical protein
MDNMGKLNFIIKRIPIEKKCRILKIIKDEHGSYWINIISLTDILLILKVYPDLSFCIQRCIQKYLSYLFLRTG